MIKIAKFVLNQWKKRMNKQATYILTSDWHLADVKPICRTDAFFPAMWKKVMFIKELAIKHDCPVLHSGDLFNKWKASPDLLSRTIRALPDKFYTIYGNHDLPEHSLAQAELSGVHTLWVGNHLDIPSAGVHFGLTPEHPTFTIRGKRKILMWHVLTYKGKDLPNPKFSGLSAKEILKKYPEYDLIVTGDNHKTFVQEYEGRLLVNPGSILRTTAAQIDFKPSVFLYYALTNTVEQVFLPIEDDVISREHLDEVTEAEKRIDAFISSLDSDFIADLSFEKNLEIFFDANKVREIIKQIILKSLEE